MNHALWTAALCAIVLSVTGCGSADGSGRTADGGTGGVGTQGGTTFPGPPRGGRVVIGVQQEPERLCEILSSMATTGLVCNLIFSKFVKYDDQFRLIPDLIEAVPTVENGGISPDYLTYTYRLKKGVRWHDGTPLTSRDVRFTYDTIMNPEVNVESREGWDVIERVETPDDHTVVFRLTEPYPDFVAETFFEESVLPSHLLREETGSAFNTSAFHHSPVGSGPFKFVVWGSGSHILLTRNDMYYGEGPYLDEIIIKFTPDETALLVQLKTGEIDYYDSVDPSLLSQIEDLPGINVYRTPALMYEHLDFNTEHPILEDRRIRQALAYATDKEDLVRTVYKGLVEVAPLDEHPLSRYYHPDAAARVTYDPLRARQLLREAGWVDTNGDGIADKDGRGLKLSITTTAGRLNRERTEKVLRKQYREVGVDLAIENHNATLLFGSYEDGGILKRGKFDIAMYAWLSSPEPATKEALYATHNVPPKGLNYPRIRHEELTRLLQRGSREVDEEERVRVYHEVADILVEEVPAVPLFWYTNIDACTERLRNMRPNPTQSSDTWNANLWYLDRQSLLSERRAPRGH